MYIYLRLIPLIYQTAQQAFRMIDHARRRLSEGGGSIVAEGHDASIGNLLREEIFQPERFRFRVCPGVNRITAQSVHGHDTGVKSDD